MLMSNKFPRQPLKRIISECFRYNVNIYNCQHWMQKIIDNEVKNLDDWIYIKSTNANKLY